MAGYGLMGLVDAANTAGGRARDRLKSAMSSAPDRMARGVDVVREKLHLEPPIENYGRPNIEDTTYVVDRPTSPSFLRSSGSQYDPRTVPKELGFGGGSIFHGRLLPGTVRERGEPSAPPAEPYEVHAYRSDPTGKYGGKNGLETLPTKLNGLTLYSMARDMAAAKSLGAPQLSVQQLAGMALKEGRADYGNNDHYYYSGDTDDISVAANRYKSLGVPTDNASFLATIQEKQAVAKRLGITFEEAWNGTGVNKHGKTGKDYSRDFQHHFKAADKVENKQLTDLIRRAIADGNKYPIKKASGGVIIDNGNPAKRERLI